MKISAGGSRPLDISEGGMRESSTQTLAIRGAKWMSLGVALQRAVQTVALIVLARLLTPDDFGLIAVAFLVLSFVHRVKGLGLHTALVQQREDLTEAANACFFINTGLTTLTFVLILAVSPFASDFFGDPRAGTVLAVMSLRLFPQALAAVPNTLAVIKLDFRKQTLVMLAESLTSAILSVALALIGWGPWALVAGSLAGALVSAILWWVLVPWRPSRRLDREVTRRIVHSGIRIWSSGNLAYLIESCSRLFVGGFLGLTRLGYYEIITRMVHAPLQSLFAVYDRVAVPAFCRVQKEKEKLGRWFLRLTGLMLILTAMLAGLLFFYSGQLILVLFGPRWAGAVEPARALALFALLAPLLAAAPVYIATGRVGLLLKYTAARSAVTIALLWLAAHHSLTAVCAAESLAALVFAPVNLVIVARLTGIRPRSMLSALSVPAAGLAAFAAVALGARAVGAELVGEPSLGSLLVFVLPPVAAFALAVVLRRPRLLSEGKEILLVALGSRENP
jgi:PST family polysaccharide transporter